MVPTPKRAAKRLQLLNEAKGPVFKIATTRASTKSAASFASTRSTSCAAVQRAARRHEHRRPPAPLPRGRAYLTLHRRRLFGAARALTALLAVSGRAGRLREWMQWTGVHRHWSLWQDLRLLLKTCPPC